MSRTLSANLDSIQTSATTRQPAWKLYIYDVRSTSDTINDVVLGNALETLTGPRDFTGDASAIQFDETAGSFVGDGIRSSSVTLQIVDPGGIFDPFLSIADPTGDGRWFRRGNVVRVVEGDSRLDETEWITTFTGEMVGQAGYLRSRAPQGESVLSCKARDRSYRFLQFEATSADFGISTQYVDLATTVATDLMGLAAGEIDFAGWGLSSNGRVTGHTSTQFVQIPPLVMIANCMFPDGFIPVFNGEGKLTQQIGVSSRLADRIYEDGDLFLRISQPFNEKDPINEVTVVGLSAVMKKIVQPSQVLTRASITTGYFSLDEEIKVVWSEDKTKQAQNVSLTVLKSVAGALTWLGGNESLTVIPAQTTPVEGSLEGTIDISTGFGAALIPFLTGLYVGLAADPDAVVVAVQTVPVEGTGTGVGETISIGRIAQALALITAQFIMSNIGHGEYEVTGEPFEYFFQEIRGIARVSGLQSWQINSVTIENQLIQTQAMANDAARFVLFREQAKGNPRSASAFHDLRLEPDDVFEFDESNRTFIIERIQRTLSRGQAAGRCNYSLSETTPGVVG